MASARIRRLTLSNFRSYHAAQIEGEAAVLKLADPGSPTLILDKDSKGALYVLMPMRVLLLHSKGGFIELTMTAAARIQRLTLTNFRS